jgi:hypothetical protein
MIEDRTIVLTLYIHNLEFDQLLLNHQASSSPAR